MIKVINDPKEILEFTWSLTQENSKSSYHKITSKVELIDKLNRGIECNTEKLIACYENNMLKGVCLYFWIDEDKYAQTTVFVIDTDYNTVADELIGYIRKELPDYELLIGIPFDNVNAIKYFKYRDIECIESSYDTRLKSENYIPNDIKYNIEAIDSNSFDEYANFHDKHAGDIYWISSRLKERLDIFRIFVYRHEGIISGSIFVTKYAEGAEVFGMYIDDKVKDNGIDSALIYHMLGSLYDEFDDINEVVYFIDENAKEELSLVLGMGFEINDTYRCYKVSL